MSSTSLSYIFSQLLNGFLIGLIYGLVAVGITLIFGVMKLVNFAHGEIYMIGGYTIYYLSVVVGIYTAFALPGSIIVTFLIGLIIERILIRPMYTKYVENASEYAMIVTFGLSILLMNIVLLIFGWRVHGVPPFISGIITISLLSVAADRITAAVAGAILLVILLFFINKTWYGKALRATSQNREGAAMVGIDTTQMNTLAYALGCALAGAGGGILATIFTVNVEMGQVPALRSFAIIVLGGMGSVKGSIIGAIILGVLESVASILISPAYQDVVGFLVLIAILLFRPQGLFGEKVRRF